MSGNASSTAASKCLTNYLRRKFSYILQEIFVMSSYLLECHIIYLLFTKVFCKSRLSTTIGYHKCVAPYTFSEIFIYRKFYIWLHRKFLFSHFASRKRNMSSRPDYAIVFVLDTFNTTISNLGYGIPYRFWMFRLEDALTNCKKLQHTLKVKDEKIVSLETRYKINCFTWHVYNNNNFICIQTYTLTIFTNCLK
jgi:hypothetical protein